MSYGTRVMKNPKSHKTEWVKWVKVVVVVREEVYKDESEMSVM